MIIVSHCSFLYWSSLESHLWLTINSSLKIYLHYLSSCIQVWNRRTNTAWAALTLTGHSGTVRCLHLHGNRLVSGSSDRTIKVKLFYSYMYYCTCIIVHVCEYISLFKMIIFNFYWLFRFGILLLIILVG